MKKSVCKGILDSKELKIAVNIYLGYDPTAMEGQLFHDGCGGKIYERRYCEKHPEKEFPATYTGIQLGGRTVRLSAEIKDDLLERSFEKFTVVGFYPLSVMGQAIAQHSFVPMGLYEIMPEPNKAGIKLPNDAMFAALSEKLTTQKKFMLIEAPLCGMRRFCAVFPNGRQSMSILPLLYQEEIRQFDMLSHDGYQYASDALKLIRRLSPTSFPKLSAKRILARVQKWYDMAFSGKDIVAIAPVDKPATKKAKVKV